MSGMVLKQEISSDNIRRAVLSDISQGKPSAMTERKVEKKEGES
jgi:hypothetical protein